MAKRKMSGKNTGKFVSAENKNSNRRRKKFEITNLEERLMLSGDDINPYPDMGGFSKVTAVESSPVGGDTEASVQKMNLNTSLGHALSVQTSVEFNNLGENSLYGFSADEIDVDNIQTMINGTTLVPLLNNKGALLCSPDFTNNGTYIYLPSATSTADFVTVTIDVYKTDNTKVETKTIFAIAENVEPGTNDATLTKAELSASRFSNKGNVSETEGSWADVVRLQHWFNYNGFRNASGGQLNEDGIPDSNLGEAIERFKRTWYSATAIIEKPRELSKEEANYRLSLNTPRWEDFSSSLQTGTGNDVTMPTLVTDTFGASHLLDLLKKVKKTDTLNWEIGNICSTSLAPMNDIFTEGQWHDFPDKFASQMKSNDLGDGTKTLAEFFNIDNDVIRAHFLGQASQETRNFSLLYEGAQNWENIKRSCANPDNISSFIKRFCENGVYNGKNNTQWAKATWDGEKYTYIPQTDAQMAQWWNNLSSQAKFNYIYSRRLGNGDIASNDGYLYSGKGLKQLTFRGNYVEYRKWLVANNVFDFTTPAGQAKDPVAHPEMVASNDQVNLLSALWYITNKNGYLNATKLGMTRNGIKAVAQALNGSSGNGLQRRYNETVEFYNEFLSHYTNDECKTVLDSVHQSGNAVEIRFTKTNSGNAENDKKADAENIYKIISLYNRGAIGTPLQLETVYMGTDILEKVAEQGTADNFKPFLGLPSLNGNDYWSIHLVYGLRNNNLSVISSQNQKALKQVAERQGLQKVLMSSEQVVQKGFSGTLVNILNNRLPQEFKIGDRSISFEDLAVSKITSVFNFDTIIRDYLDSEGEFASYEGLSSAIQDYIEERISINLESVSDTVIVDVTFDEATNKLNFSIGAEIISNHSIPFSLPETGLDTKIDSMISVNFTVGMNIGLDLNDFLADPENYTLSDNDIYFQVDEVTITGEANVSVSPEKSFMVGSIEFNAEVKNATFNPSSSWYLYKDDVENKCLTLADIKNGDFEWYNNASGPLSAELTLVAKGTDVEGEATLIYTDEDLFENGDEDISIAGTLVLPNGFKIGNGLIELGRTELTFDSVTKTIEIYADSASIKVGEDLLNIALTDSNNDPDTYAVSGEYNYETGNFELDIDIWALDIKGLLSAQGETIHFNWNDKDQTPGQEILYLGPITNAKLIPIDKELEFAGKVDPNDGETKTLSIYDNGFKLYGIDVTLADNVNLGSGALAIEKPTVTFGTIEYIKGSAGLAGEIGISAKKAEGDIDGKVKLSVTDGVDGGDIAIDGVYNLSTKRFALLADQTKLEVKDANGKLRLEGTADTMKVNYFFGDDGQNANEEVLFVEGDINLKMYTNESNSSEYKQVTVAAQQMLVNGEYQKRSLSLTGNSFMLGNASLGISDTLQIGEFGSFTDLKLVLNNFGYNRDSKEFTGKIGFSAAGAGFGTGSNVSLKISKTVGDAIEVYYDLNNKGFEGTIDRISLIVNNGSNDIFLVDTTGVKFTVIDNNGSLVAENVSAMIPDAPVPVVAIGKVTIDGNGVIVTHKGTDYSMPGDLTGLLNALAGDLLSVRDDDVVITQVGNVLKVTDQNNNTTDYTLGSGPIVIDLGTGVDRAEISSDIDLQNTGLTIKSEYITVTGDIANAGELNFLAESQFSLDGLDIISLLLQAFSVELGNGAPSVQINYDTLINRLLGRSEAIVSVIGSDIKATKVNFDAKVNVVGKSTGLLPIDFTNRGGDASKLKINGLTTALASVQAKALVNILNSVIETSSDFTLNTSATVRVENEAIAEAQEDGQENDGESTDYEAVVALAIVNSKSIAAVGGNSQLNISGKITLNAANVTEVTNTANGIPELEDGQEEEDRGKAYGGSFGILVVNKDTEASIGSDVTLGSDIPTGIEAIADSTTTVTNDVTAAAGGAKDNNDSNTSAMQDNGGENGSGDKVNVAGAAAITIVNNRVDAFVNPKTTVDVNGKIKVNAISNDTITSNADGQTVDGTDANVGIGVAVALNVVNLETNASAEDISAKDVEITAGSTSNIKGNATAGAGGEEVGIAGAVAVNTIDQITTAQGKSSLEVDGGLTIAATATMTETKANALPKEDGATSGNVGVGASFALNDINVDTIATDKDAVITGTVNTLEINAKTDIKDTVAKTQAGTESTGNSGVAVSPSVAVNVVQADTKAEHDATSMPSIGTGGVSITSDNIVNVDTIAKASAEGNVAVGASIGVAVIKTKNDALVKSSLTSTGGVDITATNEIDSMVNVEAAPRVSDESTDKKSDEEANSQLKTSRLSAADQKSANADSTISNQNSSAESEGGSSSGGVSVAASIGVNVVTTDNTAAVVDGADIDATGDVTINAMENIDVVTQAVSAAFDTSNSGSAQIGAGVGLNVVNKTNRAIVSGAAAVSGNNVKVAAETVDNNKSAILAVAAAAGTDGAAVSATAGVNVVNSTSTAELDGQASIDSDANTTITAKNETNIHTLVLAGGVSENSAGVGAAISVNVLNSDVYATVNGDITSGGDVIVEAYNNLIPEEHTFTVFEQEVMGVKNQQVKLGDVTAVSAAGAASSGSAGVAGSFIVNVFTLKTITSINKGAVIDADNDVTITADSETTINNIAGTIGISGGSAGVGVGCDVTIVNKETSAIIDNRSTGSTADLNAGGILEISADSTETVTSVVVGIAAADSAAVGVTASILVITTDTKAGTGYTPEAGNTIKISAGDTTIFAKDTMKATQVVAGITASGSAAVGGAAAVLVHKDIVDARIGEGSTLISSGFVGLSATSSEEVVQVGALVAASGGASIAATAVVANFDENTKASVGKNATVEAENDLSVSATDTTGHISVLGNVAAGSAGVGVGGSVVIINKHTNAEIGENAVLRSEAANIIIRADSSETNITITAGISAGSVGVGLNASVNYMDINTKAIVGSEADILAEGSVLISANDDIDLDMVTATGAAGTAGIGLAAGVAVINQDTIAEIADDDDNGAKVTGKGNAAGIDFNYGQFGTLKSEDNAQNASDEGAMAPMSVEGYIKTNDKNGSGVGSADDMNKMYDNLSSDAEADPVTLEKESDSEIAEHDDAIKGINSVSEDKTGFKGVAVTAANNTDITSITAGIGVGAAGVTLNAGVTVIDENATAKIGNWAKINTEEVADASSDQDVLLASANNLNYTAVTASFAGGAVGVAPAVNVAVAKIDTITEIGSNAKIYAKNDITASAKASERLLGVAFGGAAGLVAIGGSVQVINIENETMASVADNTEIDAKGDFSIYAEDVTKSITFTGGVAGGLVGIGATVGVLNVSKDTEITINGTVKADNVEAKAKNSEDLFQLAVAGAGGFVGVAGAISIMSCVTDVSVTIGADASITASGTITIYSDSFTNIKAFTLGVGAGFVGAGGAVSYGKIATGSHVTIAGDLSAQGSIEIHANSETDLIGWTIAGGLGAVAVNAAVATWTIGGTTTTQTADGNAVSNPDEPGADSPDDEAKRKSTDSTDGVSDLLAERQSSSSNVAPESNDNRSDISGATDAVTDPDNNKTPDTSVASPSGTNVNIAYTSDITSKADILISADGTIDITQVTPSISAGAIAVGGAVNIISITPDISTNVAGVLNAEGKIEISSSLNETVDIDSIAGQGGLVAVGAAVIVVNDSSSVCTVIEATGTNPRATSITGKSVKISSVRNITEFNARLLKPATGAVVVGASLVTIDVDGDGAKTIIGGGAQLKSIVDLTISSESYDNITSTIIPVAIGVGVLNGVNSSIDVDNSAKVEIGDTVSVSGDTVNISAYGDHVGWGRIDAFQLAGIGAGLFRSTVTNTSDAKVAIGAASITGSEVMIDSWNNYDHDSFGVNPGRYTITGDTFSGISGDAHFSLVNIGTSSDKFESDVSIGNATISGFKATTNGGVPKVSILAQTTIYLYERSDATSVSAIGNMASVTSKVNIHTTSAINIDGAEIENPDGWISLATLSNASVYNLANSHTAAFFVSLSHSKAESKLDMRDTITLNNVDFLAEKIFIAAGRVLGSSFDVNDHVNRIYVYSSAQGAAISAAGMPSQELDVDNDVYNTIDITGSSEIKAYGNISFDAVNGANLWMSNIKHSYGTVAGIIPVPNFKKQIQPIETHNTISIGTSAKVSAGVESDQTVLLLDKEQADACGLTNTAQEWTLTDTNQIDELNALNHGTVTAGMQVVRMSCDLDTSIGIGTVVRVGDSTPTYYKYLGVMLSGITFENNSDWELLPDTAFAPYIVYKADEISEKVALYYDMYVEKSGKYYRYNKKRNLLTQTYTGSEWVVTTDTDDIANSISWKIGVDINNTLKQNVVLVKPSDMPTPDMTYVNYRNMLERRIAELKKWMGNHNTEPDAWQRYNATIAMLELQIEELTHSTRTYYDDDGNLVTKAVATTHALVASFDDINASRGSVIIDLDGNLDSINAAISADRLTAAAGAEVSLYNSTPVSIEVNNITMKSNTVQTRNSDGSLAVLTGGSIYINKEPTETVSASDESSVTVLQDTVENLVFGGREELLLTNIFISGTILNEAGTVTLINKAGSINISGEIIAREQFISSKTSVNINAPGFYTVGAHPRLLTELSVWEELADESNTTHDKVGSFPSQSNVPSSMIAGSDINEMERYTRTGGTVRALGNISIIAGHINLNGTIQSGISDLEMTIIDIADKPFIYTTVNGGIVDKDSAEVTYSVNHSQESITIDDIITRNGNIVLSGDIFNTDSSGGNIKVAHGYANIKMTNDTSYTLIVNQIDTSRKNEGTITINDTMKDKRVRYSYTDELVDDDYRIHEDVWDVVFNNSTKLYEYVENTTESKVHNENQITADYKPIEGLFAIWVEGIGEVETTTYTYEKKHFNWTPGWTSVGDWLNDFSTEEGTTLLGTEIETDGEVSLEKSFGLHLLESGDTEFELLKSKGVIVVPEEEGQPIQYTADYYGKYESTDKGDKKWDRGEPQSFGGGWLSEEGYTVKVTEVQAKNNYYSHYLYASNEIEVDFSGGHEESTIEITSKGDVILQGDVTTPENSTMTVTSEGEVNVADNVIFSGVTPDIQNVKNDITMTVVISDEPLNITTDGNITINAVSADGSTDPLIIGEVISTSGTVTINSATGVVAEGSDSIVKGETVYIHAANGSIGEETLALKIDTDILGENAGGVAAYASEDIYLTEIEGDMRLIKDLPGWENATASIQSIAGDVNLATIDGSIINDTEIAAGESNVRGEVIVLTTGGSGEVLDVVVGMHSSIYATSSSNITLSTEGDMNIAHIASGDVATLSAGGNIVDIGSETAAVLAVNGISLNSDQAIKGFSSDNFNVQMGTAAALTVNASGDSWINQVAQDGSINGIDVPTDGMTVNTAHSDSDIRLSTVEGDLRIGLVTAGKNVKLEAAGNIVESAEYNVGNVNVDTSGAESGTGNVELIAGNAIGQYNNFFDLKVSGQLTASSLNNTYIGAVGALTVSSATSTNGDMVFGVWGDVTVMSMIAANGTVAIDTNGSILNGRTDNGEAISAGTIVLNSEDGTIGTETKSFAVDSTSGTVTAEAALEVYMVEHQGTMNINSITSETSEAVVTAIDGMVDANSSFTLGLDNFGLENFRITAPVTDLNVAATSIHLISSEGGIGTLADAIEIDVYGERVGRIFADAKGDISIDEIVGSMNVGTVESSEGIIALGTPDTTNTGEDIYLDDSSLVRALNGNIHVRAGDNLYHLTGAMIIAGNTIFLYGDFDNADTGVGSEIKVQGSISAILTQISGNDDNDTILLDVRDVNTVDGRVEAYGREGDDTITALQLDTEQIHLYGEENDDTIDAEAMTNRVHIYGGTGIDTITGGHAGDVIFGGGDDDAIVAGDGTDLVFGDGGQLIDNSYTVAFEDNGTGKDNIEGGSGADVIIGDNGTINTVGFYSSDNTLETLVSIDNTALATGDDDTITESDGDDIILGGTGADSIESGAGNDAVIGDAGTVSFEKVDGVNYLRSIDTTDQSVSGDDTITSGSGDDTVMGGAGTDTIDGGEGSDILFGDTAQVTYATVDGANYPGNLTNVDQTVDGNDTITGGTGDDRIFGGGGDDTIDGSEDNDIILGDTGSINYEAINGTNHLRSVTNADQTVSGDDTITGGSGEDYILGGDGADAIQGNEDNDIIFGDTGTLTFETVDGKNNITTLSNSDQTIGGNDSITGDAGSEFIFGGAGNDTIDGGTEGDTILGDTGKISFVVAGGTNQVISIDARNQSVDGDDIITGGTGAELIIAGDGKDSVDAGSGDDDDIILGDTGIINYELVEDQAVVESIVTNGEVNGDADVINAGGGMDVVIGGEAGDEINAGDGRNSIIVGDNGEVVYDNPDLEHHYVNHVTALDIDIGGDDTIQTGSTVDIILGGMGADTIHSSTGEDIILGDNGTVQFGNGLLDIIYTADNDQGGNDTIVAGNDDKIILGGFADDTISSLDGDDIVLGDNGYVDFDAGVLIEANSDGDTFGGTDTIDAGVGRNNVIGGIADDVITTGIDHVIEAMDIREAYSNDNDVVIGDNGRITFNQTGEQVDSHESATLSFNFQGAAQNGIASTHTAGAPESKVGEWINIQSNGPGTYGNNDKEIIRTDYGQRLAGLRLTWGGKESHRTDSIELNNYLMENYYPDYIRDPDTNQLIPGDGRLFAGGVRTSAPNTQCDNKLEVEMDGLNKYFKEYSVIVYIDAPQNVSSFIQNPSDSTLGSIYGVGESIRKIAIDSADYSDAFFIDDAASNNDPSYNIFDGEYIKAFAKDALSSYGNYANYVVFEGLSDDRFVVTITDGVLNVNYNGRDLPSIAGIQIIGTFHPVDNIETSVTEAGGDDIISTAGGDDIVLGGVGSDTIATFGDIRDGIDDADTVIGDNGIATVMYRSGWLTEDEGGSWITTVLAPEIVHAESVNSYPEIMDSEVQFNDLIFTGNGNDVVLGGDGLDRINTQRHDDIVSDIWGDDESTAPEAMKQVNLSALQNFETDGVKVLSLNFSYADSDATRNKELKVADGEYAGVVAANYWNNVDLRDELNPNQYPNPYYNTEFVLSDGTLASGLNLNIQAREDWGGVTSLQADRSNGHDQISPDSENSKLFESYYWAQKQQTVEININNIGDQTGFEVYDVYLYIDGDNERTEDDNYIWEISGGDRYGALSSFYLNDWKGYTFNGEFKEVTATSYSVINDGIVPNMDMIGNYVVFRNVTAEDFAIRIKNVSVGDQYPLNMPCISAVQIVAGDMKDNVALNSDTGNVAPHGDYDKDVVIGDHGKVNYTIDVPYGTRDDLTIAQNKVYEAVSNDEIKAGVGSIMQSDYIVTGRNQDLVIAGNGSDAVDSGAGSDVVIADNAEVQLVDYNPIGVRQPYNVRILDLTSTDNDAYVGKTGSTADQFISKINAGNVIGINATTSSRGGDDIVDAGADDDLIYGMEGDDVLIGNEGADVIYDTSGVNSIKDSAYANAAAYEADMSDVSLDTEEDEAMDEFISNDFNQTENIGELLEDPDGSGDTGGDTGDTGDITTIDISDGQAHTITLDGGESVILTATTWPGKDNPWWNPNIALIFGNTGSAIPTMDVSWDISGVTQSATIPPNNWDWWLSQIPDSPNDDGAYTIVLTANTAGTFTVQLGTVWW
jgi:predicted chitinase